MGANSATARGPVAQLPWVPLLAEGVAEVVHEGHGLVFSHAQEQIVDVVRMAQTVALLLDDWAQVDSWFVACDGTREGYADVAEAVGAVGVLTCIVVFQSSS